MGHAAPRHVHRPHRPPGIIVMPPTPTMSHADLLIAMARDSYLRDSISIEQFEDEVERALAVTGPASPFLPMPMKSELR